MDKLQETIISRDSQDAKQRGILARGRAKDIDLVKRRAWFIASTNEVDRQGEVVLPSAFKARMGKFMRHSPFLASHAGQAMDGTPTQIGTVFNVSIKSDRVEIGTQYAMTDLAEQYWILASDPDQTVAVSIGFIPIKAIYGAVADLVAAYPELKKPFQNAELNDDSKVSVYTEIELLEVSQVSVPANRGAIQMGMGGDRIEAMASSFRTRLAPDDADQFDSIMGQVRDALYVKSQQKAIDEFMDEYKAMLAETGGVDQFGQDLPIEADDDSYNELQYCGHPDAGHGDDSVNERDIRELLNALR